MKNRVVSFMLAMLLLVMIPAETVMAAPITRAESMVALTDVPKEELTEEPEAAEESEVTPGAEAAEEPEVTPEAEATEKPEAEASEEPTAEPEADQGPEATEESTEEPEVTEEPTAEPEVTEEPAAEPEVTEEPAEEATEEPTENPEAEETAFPEETPVMEENAPEEELLEDAEDTAEPEDILPEGDDLTGQFLEDEGIRCEGVVYLTKKEVDALSSDEREEYLALCEMVASWIASGMQGQYFAFSIDEEGNLKLSMEVSGEKVTSSDTDMQYSERIDNSTNPGGTLTAEELDALLADKAFFKNQLDSTEKAIYNAGKKAIIDNGKKKFSYTTKYKKAADLKAALGEGGGPLCEQIHFSLSALVNTYPTKFERFKDFYDYFFWDIVRDKNSGKYRLDVKLQDAAKDMDSLEKKTKAKVNQVVAQAKQYTKENNPNNPMYAMIAYFDNYLCENTYYGKLTSSRFENRSYGPLLYQCGKDEGYALAMSRLLDAAGIRNMCVYGQRLADSGYYRDHVWNYVQMNDNKWYLLDTHQNRQENWRPSTKINLLVKLDTTKYSPSGRSVPMFGGYYTKSFTYPKLNTSNYNATYEQVLINSNQITYELYLKPGKTYQQKPSALGDSFFYYFPKYEKTWKSTNPNIVKVNQSGKITAQKPGWAAVDYTIGTIKKRCNVFVYKFTGLRFEQNSKNTLTETWGNPSREAFDSVITKKITVKQSNQQTSAQRIKEQAKLAGPTVTSDNKKVAEATVSLSGDTITLNIKPKKLGKAKITVKFQGQTATYNLTVKHQIQDKWIDTSKVEDKNYSGKAFTPKITKSKAAGVVVPKDFTFTVSYKNNIKAGTATVTIKGTGNYTGKITKEFRIRPKDINELTCTIGTMTKDFNGKSQNLGIVLKDGKKVLKERQDYDIYYNNGWYSSGGPSSAGTYEIRVSGIGNYSGTIKLTDIYEIKTIPVSKLTIACPKEVTWKNGKPITPPVKVKIGKNILKHGSDFVIKYYKITKDSAGEPVRTRVFFDDLRDRGNYVAVISPYRENIVWGDTQTIEKKFTIKKK